MRHIRYLSLLVDGTHNSASIGNFIPATINYTEPDELCDLDYVPNFGREQKVNTILKDASGFSGIHSAIVLRKYKG